MRRWLALTLLLVGAGYPFMVYFGLNHLSPAWLMLPLALLWLARAAVPSTTGVGAGVGNLALTRWLPWAAGAICLGLALHGSYAGLRVYPVFVNLLFLSVFGLSLSRHFGPPVIERLARLRHPDLPVQGRRYTRKVTVVWCVFFAVNGTIAGVLALWGNWAWWTLYNGAISYMLMGALLLGEWCVRPRVKNG